MKPDTIVVVVVLVAVVVVFILSTPLHVLFAAVVMIADVETTVTARKCN
jgi:hypothetical protein